MNADPIAAARDMVAQAEAEKHAALVERDAAKADRAMAIEAQVALVQGLAALKTETARAPEVQAFARRMMDHVRHKMENADWYRIDNVGRWPEDVSEACGDWIAWQIEQRAAQIAKEVANQVEAKPSE